MNSACWGKRRLRPGRRMIVVAKVEKGQRVKDRKHLSYGREKKGAHIPRKKSHQGPLLGQGGEVVNSSLFPLWWVWKSQDFFKCKLQKPILKCLKKKKKHIKQKTGRRCFLVHVMKSTGDICITGGLDSFSPFLASRVFPTLVLLSGLPSKAGHKLTPVNFTSPERRKRLFPNGSNQTSRANCHLAPTGSRAHPLAQSR